jgi:hypothetical protein
MGRRARSTLKKFINKRLDRRTMILPVIMEVLGHCFAVDMPSGTAYSYPSPV